MVFSSESRAEVHATGRCGRTRTASRRLMRPRVTLERSECSDEGRRDDALSVELRPREWSRRDSNPHPSIGDRVVPAAFAAFHFAAERGGLAPQCLAAPLCLAGRPGTSAGSALRGGSTGNRTPPFITGHRFSRPAADHSAGCLHVVRPGGVEPPQRAYQARPWIPPRRPVGPRQWSRTTLGRLVVPMVAPATLPRSSSEVRGSNSPSSPCGGVVVTRRRTSGGLSAASRTRCNDLRTVASGSARTESCQRQKESPRRVARLRVGLQSTPTAGSRARSQFRSWTRPESHRLALLAGQHGILMHEPESSSSRRAGQELHPAPEIWRLRCALRSDPWRRQPESNRTSLIDSEVALPAHQAASRQMG